MSKILDNRIADIGLGCVPLIGWISAGYNIYKGGKGLSGSPKKQDAAIQTIGKTVFSKHNALWDLGRGISEIFWIPGIALYCGATLIYKAIIGCSCTKIEKNENSQANDEKKRIKNYLSTHAGVLISKGEGPPAASELALSPGDVFLWVKGDPQNFDATPFLRKDKPEDILFYRVDKQGQYNTLLYSIELSPEGTFYSKSMISSLGKTFKSIEEIAAVHAKANGQPEGKEYNLRAPLLRSDLEILDKTVSIPDEIRNSDYYKGTFLTFKDFQDSEIGKTPKKDELAIFYIHHQRTFAIGTIDHFDDFSYKEGTLTYGSNEFQSLATLLENLKSS